jgi:hypothetical protein
MIARGHLTLDAAVEILVLEEQHAVVVANRGLHQALCVFGSRRVDDLETRRVDVAGFRIL